MYAYNLLFPFFLPLTLLEYRAGQVHDGGGPVVVDYLHAVGRVEGQLGLDAVVEPRRRVAVVVVRPVELVEHVHDMLQPPRLLLGAQARRQGWGRKCGAFFGEACEGY